MGAVILAPIIVIVVVKEARRRQGRRVDETRRHAAKHHGRRRRGRRRQEDVGLGVVLVLPAGLHVDTAIAIATVVVCRIGAAVAIDPLRVSVAGKRRVAQGAAGRGVVTVARGVAGGGRGCAAVRAAIGCGHVVERPDVGGRAGIALATGALAPRICHIKSPRSAMARPCIISTSARNTQRARENGKKQKTDQKKTKANKRRSAPRSGALMVSDRIGAMPTVRCGGKKKKKNKGEQGGGKKKETRPGGDGRRGKRLAKRKCAQTCPASPRFSMPFFPFFFLFSFSL
ncbi:hypothetical protein [Pandoravirus japonicus]|uniref:Uncharacterized protein n=1 Tax=Pandoravirus japonicus TaxID=2823154 RepID=A0A811BRQ5_9VIRU|nr:hypothetical protein [Pandoravirus japonicus]